MHKRHLLLVLLVLLGALFPLYSKVLFVQTIPINGMIGLEERFSLEITQTDPIVFSDDLAGRELEIATYEFYSNSQETTYQLRIVSADTARQLGQDDFAFLFVGQGSHQASTIPFKIGLRSSNQALQKESAQNYSSERAFGGVAGTPLIESGSIVITLPSKSEGFEFKEIISGYYQANITVEVSSD